MLHNVRGSSALHHRASAQVGAGTRFSVCVSRDPDLDNPKIRVPSGSQTATGGSLHQPARLITAIKTSFPPADGFFQGFQNTTLGRELKKVLEESRLLQHVI
jgi:hypothetical protein